MRRELSAIICKDDLLCSMFLRLCVYKLDHPESMAKSYSENVLKHWIDAFAEGKLISYVTVLTPHLITYDRSNIVEYIMSKFCDVENDKRLKDMLQATALKRCLEIQKLYIANTICDKYGTGNLAMAMGMSFVDRSIGSDHDGLFTPEVWEWIYKKNPDWLTIPREDIIASAAFTIAE